MDHDVPARTPSPSPRAAAPWSPHGEASLDAPGSDWRSQERDAVLDAPGSDWRSLDGDAALLSEKRGRTRFLPAQVAMLERSFQESEALNVHKATRLSRAVGVEVRQVYVWYQNRRARRRQKDLDPSSTYSTGQSCSPSQPNSRKATQELEGPAKKPRGGRAQHQGALQEQAKVLLASIASRSPHDIEDARKWRSICADLNALAAALTTLHSPAPGQDRLAWDGASVACSTAASVSLDGPQPPVPVPCQGVGDEPRLRDIESAQPLCREALLDLDLRLGPASELERGCCSAGDGEKQGGAAPCSGDLDPFLRNLSDDESSPDTQRSTLQGQSSEAHPCSSASASSGALLTYPSTPEAHRQAVPVWV